MTRRPSIDARQTFTVDLGYLVRTVTRRQGGTYSHRCSLESYREVAHCIEEHAGAGVTTTTLWELLPDVPCTQASVAVAFLKERGCLVVAGRRLFPASRSLFEDAMLEFHALERYLDYAEEAESAERAGAWPQAEALWRRAADMCDDAGRREQYLAQAARCGDLQALRQEDRPE